MASPQQLDGVEFAQMVRMGHRHLNVNVSVVNKLNVFPVPDGDTGTNMELSMASGVARLNEQTEWTLQGATHAFASGLLMGARGNSGVILSQLFRGFSKISQTNALLNVEQFSIALFEGVQIAYRAVAKPVEGTILTVASAAANTGVKLAKQERLLAPWLQAVYESACIALEKTPLQLAVLQQAGVVDSGGQGFVYILEGFLAYLNGENAGAERILTAALKEGTTWNAVSHIAHEGEFGYCTEVLIRVHDAEVVERRLRKQLALHGDSMLVVGADQLVKVHIHTLHPGRVLEEAIAHGPLVKIKIDNMTEQYHDIHGDVATETVDVSPPQGASMASEMVKPCAVVAVASGDGLKSIFESLGADVVVSGGQTMNPSTEDLVKAVKSLSSSSVVILPNNKNIVLAAEQAQNMLGPHVFVVPTTTVPQGIAAMIAYGSNRPASENARDMAEAAEAIITGSVVRAVRDSVFQEQEIREGQYLGFLNQTLVMVSDQREDLVIELIGRMKNESSELVTLFYGGTVTEDHLAMVQSVVLTKYQVGMDAKYGGQPVYDYILTVE